MKVDLTPREIELLLLLINDAAAGDFSLDGPPIFSSEELALIKKLESALETTGAKERPVSPGQTSNQQH